VSIAYNL